MALFRKSENCQCFNKHESNKKLSKTKIKPSGTDSMTQKALRKSIETCQNIEEKPPSAIEIIRNKLKEQGDDLSSIHKSNSKIIKKRLNKPIKPSYRSR